MLESALAIERRVNYLDKAIPKPPSRSSTDPAGGRGEGWRLTARENQITPEGDWRTWLILAGRGWGKTRTGAEDAREYGLANPKTRYAIVAPTYPDARDTCVEGESGLLAILPEGSIQNWNRSLGELILTNGTRYKLFSADKPERLRGPQHHRAWCDELGSWKYVEQAGKGKVTAWDMLMFGLRLGKDPRAVVTTTPKPYKVIKDLMAAATTHLTRGSTYENKDNLARAFFSDIITQYEGTRLGRQELNAEILDDNPSALWNRQQIENLRKLKAPELSRIVVAIDPSGSSSGNEAGIIVGGIGPCFCKGKTETHGFVLEDSSMQGSPNAWAAAAVTAYYSRRADRIIGEQNNGGEMVENTVRTVDASVSYKKVWASRGKYTRAEPVSSLYEQGKVHHVGMFPQLEDELCQWEPNDPNSPNRLDALVWAFTELMVDKQYSWGVA